MASSYISVIKKYNESPAEIRQYFSDFEELVKNYSWEIPTSYAFHRVEKAKRYTIYCGMVKLHLCESTLTWDMVQRDYMSRKRFWDLFRIVYGSNPPKDLVNKLETGEKIRDKIAHGMQWKAAEARTGLVSVLTFAADFNEYVYKSAQFRPFSDLRGYKGRAKSLEKKTTRWILKGMGIPAKEEISS